MLLKKVAFITASLLSTLSFANLPTVEMWKNPSCGCCNEWKKHMEQNGFKVVVHNTGNSEKRLALGIQPKFGACHTAVVEGYALEGHIPAEDVKRLLAEKPKGIGLAVPGMPIGSPGMDGEAYHGQKTPYDTLLLEQNGGYQVFQSH